MSGDLLEILLGAGLIAYSMYRSKQKKKNKAKAQERVAQTQHAETVAEDVAEEYSESERVAETIDGESASYFTEDVSEEQSSGGWQSVFQDTPEEGSWEEQPVSVPEPMPFAAEPEVVVDDDWLPMSNPVEVSEVSAEWDGEVQNAQDHFVLPEEGERSTFDDEEIEESAVCTSEEVPEGAMRSFSLREALIYHTILGERGGWRPRVPSRR